MSRRGIEGRFLSLADCAIAINAGPVDVILPGFGQPPCGVFVRGVPGGALEQVIFRLNILHALHERGVTVYNTPRAIEKTVDKPLTSLLLSRAGLPTPPTWICESLDQAHAILRAESASGHQTLQKPLFGSQGVGLHQVGPASGLIHDEKFAGVYYLQRFIARRPGRPYSDMRVLVIDGRARAAMRRSSDHWLTNRARGAVCEPLPLTPALSAPAEAACKVLRIDYAGVDLIQDQAGDYFIIEVNSIPAWYGLQQVVDFNIGACLIDSFVRHIEAN